MNMITDLKQLPPPDCKYGYSWAFLEEHLDEQQLKRLGHWMRGQTMAMCDGREYDYDKEEYHPTGCGPHGGVVYSHDLHGFLKGYPILD